MYFQSLVSAVLIGAASALDIQVIDVGMNRMSSEAQLSYFPDKITAEPGTMVQFHFLAGSHTVTQSNFDNPCIPISMVDPTKQGSFSGAMDVAAGASTGTLPVWTIMIQDKNPMWLYCSTGPHCKNGMSMVINENTGANSTRSLENYKQAASQFQGTSPSPASPIGGDKSTIPGSNTESNSTTPSNSPSSPSSRPNSNPGSSPSPGSDDSSSTPSPDQPGLNMATGLAAPSAMFLAALAGAIMLC